MSYNIFSGFGAQSAQSVTNGNGPIGKTFHIAKAGSNSYAHISALYPPVDSDGVVRVYACDGTADDVEIQAAITACKGSANAYIFIYPGTYNLTAAITLAGKSGVHLIGVNGGGYDVGCTSSVYLIQGGNYANVIMSANSELTGFAIKNKAGYSAVTVPANIFSTNIHNNYFMMVLGSAVNIVDCSASEANKMGRVHHNRFYTEVSGNGTSAIYLAAGYAKDACHNIITTSGSGTLDYGIFNDSTGGDTSYNTIGEGAMTITSAIGVNALAGSTVGNNCAVATGHGLGGGTAERTFVDNRDGASGGATPIQS